MKSIYQIHSTPLETTVTVTYQNGILIAFEAADTVVTDFAKLGKKYALFIVEADFIRAAKEHNVKVTEIKRDITFEMFWDKYNYKAVGGKIEASKVWNRLSKADQTGAYDWIGYYDAQLKLNQNISKLYAATYLNAKRWIK